MSHREIYAIKRRPPSPSGERRGARRNPRQVGRYMMEEDAPSLSGGRFDARRHVPFAGILGEGSPAQDSLAQYHLPRSSLSQSSLTPGRLPLSVFENVQRIAAILAQKPRYPTDEAPSREAVARRWIAFEKKRQVTETPDTRAFPPLRTPRGIPRFLCRNLPFGVYFSRKLGAGGARRS